MTARARRWVGWLAAVVAAALVVLGAGGAAAAPRLEYAARAGRITVLAEPGLERTAVRLAASADGALDRIAGDLGDLPGPGAITVRLVRDARDLAAVAPAGRGAPPWAIGVAYLDQGVVSVATRRGAQPVDPVQTLRHELAHIALAAALGARAPHWLHEGFAYQHSAEWSWERTETLAGMAWFGSVIPLDELDRSFPREENPAHRAYAESYDFVGYLSRRGRWEDTSDDGNRWPFRQFLAAIGHGSEPDAAAVRAFGRPLRALFDEWKADLQDRYKLMPIGLLGLIAWILCALLLVLAWLRRRSQNRKRLAQWDADDAAREPREPREPAAPATQVVAPPYVQWPGEDPLHEEPADDDDRPGGPRWVN